MDINNEYSSDNNSYANLDTDLYANSYANSYVNFYIDFDAKSQSNNIPSTTIKRKTKLVRFRWSRHDVPVHLLSGILQAAAFLFSPPLQSEAQLDSSKKNALT